MHEREAGFSRSLDFTADNVGVSLIVDGQGPDGLPLQAGEVLIVNRSTSRPLAFGPTQATASLSLGAAGAGPTLSLAGKARLKIGLEGSLFALCPTAGSAAAGTIYYR